jgi:hypothetical protein
VTRATDEINTRLATIGPRRAWPCAGGCGNKAGDGAVWGFCRKCQGDLLVEVLRWQKLSAGEQLALIGVLEVAGSPAHARAVLGAIEGETP